MVIESAVAKALADAGVRDDSAIKQALIHDSEVHDGMICVPDENGKSVSLSERLAQMREDDRWRADFPAAKPAAPGRPAPTPAGAMLQPDRSQFEAIVSGRAVVR
jgi:hypothetical protein